MESGNKSNNQMNLNYMVAGTDLLGQLNSAASNTTTPVKSTPVQHRPPDGKLVILCALFSKCDCFFVQFLFR
jgi:hypothetical protein